MAIVSNDLFSMPTGPPGMPGLEFRRALPAEIPAAIGLILSGDRPAGPAQINEFISSAPQRRIDVHDVWVATLGSRPIWAALPVLSPGHTMLLLVPLGNPDATEAAMDRLLTQVCRHYAAGGVHLVQVLLDPERRLLHEFFEQRGFRRMAELIYLQGTGPRFVRPDHLPAGMAWKIYDASTHALFASTILASYQGSLDCPFLNGMRDIEDVIAGHKGTGEFDPGLWGVLMSNEQAMGVVLLNRIPLSDALELTYLGLVPDARGKGLGDLCMRQAFWLTGQVKRRRISLAVDSTNRPAMSLYYRHGLQRIACKVALMRDLRK
jgi:GNAT superfamily N-acetyltransferase